MGLFRSREEKEAEKAEQMERAAKSQEINESALGHAVSGLPVEDGESLMVYFQDREIFIGVIEKKPRQSFELSYDRITGLEIKKDEETTVHYASDTGGAVAAAMLGSEIGAMRRGRIQKIENTETEYYFIITYDKDGESKTVTIKIHHKKPNVHDVPALKEVLLKVKPRCNIPVEQTQGHTVL